MKILSAILVFHILFLTVAPAIPMTSASIEAKQCKKSCCSTTNETKQPNKQNGDCCNSACNPFMVCCNCNALTKQTQKIPAPFVCSNQKFNIVSETNSSDFLSEAWNPPKTV